MIAATASMEFVSTATESEALLLEANLIKRFRPTYNVLMRDDKSFPYILISREHAAPPAKPPEAPSAPAVKRDAGDAQGDLGRDAQDRGEARAPFPLR